MAKAVLDEVLDAALNHLKNESKRLTATSGAAPTTFTQAVSTLKLAYVVISAGTWGSPVNGDVSGRKIIVPQVTSVPVSATGSATHVNLVDTSGGGKLLYTTEVSATQQLTAGNTMTFEAWDIEIRDPT